MIKTLLKQTLAISLTFICCFTSIIVHAQSEIPKDRVFVIGNLADVEDITSLKNELGTLIQKQNTPYLLILNGDIVKSDLNVQSNFDVAQNRLNEFASITNLYENGEILIVPGDRDWMSSGRKGLKNVERLEKLIKSIPSKAIIFDPDDGCPGPKTKFLGNTLAVVSINTQWFNHPYDKPRNTETLCKYVNEVDFIEELEDVIDETNGKNVIVVGHYPIVSNGIYGGDIPAYWHLLPGIGSLYASYRKNIGNRKDIHNKRFEPIRHKLEKLFLEKEGVIYISGHDYNLQTLKEKKNIFINSGSIAKAGSVDKEAGTIFSSRKKGLIELTFNENGNVHSTTYERNENGFQEINNSLVMIGRCQVGEKTDVINIRYDVCLGKIKVVAPQERNEYSDVIAGEEYSLENTNQFFLGERYRRSWSEEVKVPVLDLKNTWNGLKPYKLGGGRQTKSIKFVGGNGKRYTFRSVNKDLSPVIPESLRGTGAQRFVQDQTSAQMPYGAMATDGMLNQLDIPHAHPVLYVMPDDPSLGVWRKDFAGMLGMLEEDPKDWKNENTKGFYGADDIEKSYQLFHHLYESNENKVDQKTLLQARIFDVFIGDWGKHQDNWKWAEYKTEEGSVYKPIPRDRDHVFSKWDGVIPYLYTREWIVGTFARFNEKIENIEEFVWPARELDRELLNELDKNIWLEAAQFVRDKMTDEVIHESIMKMPKEIYAEDGKEIEQVLKQRREILVDKIMQYYQFLAEEVTVIGTNEREYFQVERKENGDLLVEVYALKGDSDDKDAESRFYHRLFLYSETKEVQLYGLGAKDIYNISGGSKKSILLRVIPGPGKDVVNDQSDVSGFYKKTLIYEKSDDSELNLGQEGKIKRPWNDNLYYYSKKVYKYDRYSPSPGLSFNRNDGLGISLGVKFTNQKWGKENYSRSHVIKGGITTRRFFDISVENRFHHVFRKTDIILNATMENPGDVRFFYGYGADAKLNRELLNSDFYVVRRTSAFLEGGFAKQFLQKSELQILGRYENSNDFNTDGNILGEQKVIGENKFSTIEGLARLDLDFRDHKAWPKSGSRLYSEIVYGQPQRTDPIAGKENYYTYHGGAEFFTSTTTRRFPITVGLKAGIKRASENTPFYKMPTAGIKSNLKGFRRNRFSSDRISYLNTELRVKLFDISKAFVPLEIGLTGFYDLADINPTNEIGGGKNTFTSYGGGFYLVPWEKNFTINFSVGFSEEESGLIVFGIGTLLNKGN